MPSARASTSAFEPPAKARHRLRCARWGGPAPRTTIGVGVVGGRGLRQERGAVGVRVRGEQVGQPLRPGCGVEVVAHSDHHQVIDGLERGSQRDLHPHTGGLGGAEVAEPAQLRTDDGDAVLELNDGAVGIGRRGHDERVAHRCRVGGGERRRGRAGRSRERVGPEQRGQGVDLSRRPGARVHGGKGRRVVRAGRFVGGPQRLSHPGRAPWAHGGDQLLPRIGGRWLGRVPDRLPIRHGGHPLLVVDTAIERVDVDVVREDPHAKRRSVGGVASFQAQWEQRDRCGAHGISLSMVAARNAARLGGL